MKNWSTTDLSAQSGRTIIVTGANSGLGRVTATALAGAGARVILAVRDVERGEQAAAAITGETEVRELDLADLASVRRFAADWSGPVDVLINNAGVMAVPESSTRDGFELQFGTNHLGHFALTNLLLPQLTDRVVNVSSSAHRMGEIVLDDLSWKTRPYKAWAAYGQSKLANLLFTLELERRLESDGFSVRAFAAHPGVSATTLGSHSGSAFTDRLMKVSNLLAQSAAMGALPSLFAATQDLPGASYVGPGSFGGMRGYPALVGRTAAASDVTVAKKLWDASEQLTGVGYPALVG
ncbi:oxidoreductase [Pengzhenrongella sp.]|uniref:oxidoreductase n=1 Tax=Pengzhenrongella sp. TaxID=2888820 RepID=UPI002F931611